MQPVIILVEPQLSQNIGKTARAMLNFGLTSLRLVAPREDWFNKEARMLAAGADAVLENAQCFGSFENAVADLHCIYATSARPRDMIKDVFTPQQISTRAVKDCAQDKRVGFLFGPERTGLHNDHIARANALISIPVNPEFSSLNLAQAVVVLAYEWYQSFHQPLQQYSVTGNSATASHEEVEGLLQQMEQALAAAGYFRTEHKRSLMMRNLVNMFSRPAFTAQEIRTMRGVISTLTNPNGIYSREKRRNQETD